MVYVYILKCKSKTSGRITYYTGYTYNLDRRVEQHKEGLVKSTRGREIELYHKEIHKSQKLAMKREKEIKKMPRKKKITLGLEK